MHITKYLKLAMRESRKSTLEYRVGCVIVRGGSVVGRGYNHFSGKQERISKRYGCNYFSIHAEVAALMDCDNVNGATMFISGHKFNNGVISVKPCAKCQKILKHIGIDVYYTTKNGVEKLEFD